MSPSPKQSTRDWIQIPGEISWARPTVAPLGWLPTSHIDARGVSWAHIQIVNRALGAGNSTVHQSP